MRISKLGRTALYYFLVIRVVIGCIPFMKWEDMVVEGGWKIKQRLSQLWQCWHWVCYPKFLLNLCLQTSYLFISNLIYFLGLFWTNLGVFNYISLSSKYFVPRYTTCFVFSMLKPFYVIWTAFYRTTELHKMNWHGHSAVWSLPFKNKCIHFVIISKFLPKNAFH